MAGLPEPDCIHSYQQYKFLANLILRPHPEDAIPALTQA
jgi:hypothetical protein